MAKVAVALDTYVEKKIHRHKFSSWGQHNKLSQIVHKHTQSTVEGRKCWDSGE